MLVDSGDHYLLARKPLRIAVSDRTDITQPNNAFGTLGTVKPWVQVGGISTVPAGVQGPHRKILFAAIQPPLTTPNFVITASP